MAPATAASNENTAKSRPCLVTDRPPHQKRAFPHLGDAGTPLSLDTRTRSGRVGRSRCVRRL